MKNNIIKIDIGNRFSRFPAGRTPADGKFSGEAFREKYLKDNLKTDSRIQIFFDNAVSYGSSFLEEAFGGLVRKYNCDIDTIKRRIEFISSDPFLIDEIWTYINQAVVNSEESE